MLTNEQFLKHLRDALNHLYDPNRLRRNPLANFLGVADRFDTPSRLQNILLEAIEDLKPEANDLPRPPSRRIYDLLLYRYVQQFSQQEVADQLGISVRHLRREQHAAVETLACHLWEQFRLEAKLGEDITDAAIGVDTQTTVSSPTINEELAWLKDAPPEKVTNLNQALPAVLELAQPLAARHRVRLKVETPDSLPDLAVHPVAFRQTLLNLISVAVSQETGSLVFISARPLRWRVEIQVRCKRPLATHTPLNLDDEEGSLSMARRLANLCGGKLALSTGEKGFEAKLFLPALRQLPVLVIDDNNDTLQLLQRYMAGTRYRFIGTQDPEQALELTDKFCPQIIVLDVMMPQTDGWEVLGRLKQHPLTRHVPIIVCTILAQEELAISLGASAFVRKPVTRQAFLTALDRQVVLMESEPH